MTLSDDDVTNIQMGADAGVKYGMDVVLDLARKGQAKAMLYADGGAMQAYGDLISAVEAHRPGIHEDCWIKATAFVLENHPAEKPDDATV